jgi:hypothetical protein
MLRAVFEILFSARFRRWFVGILWWWAIVAMTALGSRLIYWLTSIQ